MFPKSLDKSELVENTGLREQKKCAAHDQKPQRKICNEERNSEKKAEEI